MSAISHRSPSAASFLAAALLFFASTIGSSATTWFQEDGPLRPALNNSFVLMDLEVDHKGYQHVAMLTMPFPGETGPDVVRYYREGWDSFKDLATTQGDQEISQVELVVDQRGRVHVFIVADIGQGRHLRTFQVRPDGSTTPAVELGTSTFAPLDATLLPDGRVVVVHNRTSGFLQLLVLEQGKPPVVRALSAYFDWFISEVSVAVDENGFARVAARASDLDRVTGVRRSALIHRTASLDPSGSTGAWETVTQNAVIGPQTVAGVLDVALQPNGLPFIGFMDEIQGLMRVARFTVSGWDIDDVVGSNADRIDVGMDGNGRLSVAWQRPSDASVLRSELGGVLWSSPETLPLRRPTDVDHAPSGYLHAFGYPFNSSTNPRMLSVRPLDASDADGDGFPYLSEIAFRSNPNSPASRPQIEFSIPSNGRPSLTFDALSDTVALDDATLQAPAEGILYSIQLSDSLEEWRAESSRLATDVFSINGRKIIATSQTGTVSGSASPFMRLRVRRSP